MTETVFICRSPGGFGSRVTPWQHANSVLAAHRDAFVPSLKDLRVGDQLSLKPTGRITVPSIGSTVQSPDRRSLVVRTRPGYLAGSMKAQ